MPPFRTTSFVVLTCLLAMTSALTLTLGLMCIRDIFLIVVELLPHLVWCPRLKIIRSEVMIEIFQLLLEIFQKLSIDSRPVIVL